MYIVREYAPGLDQVITSLPEDEAPTWDAGTRYGLNDRVIRDHRIYQSVIADNLGVDPVGEDQSLVSARWIFDRFTNAYAGFDGVLSNPTAAVEDPAATADWLDPDLGIDARVNPVILDIRDVGDVDTLILFGVSAMAARVICFDIAGNLLLDRETNMSGRQVEDWWAWFFEPFAGASDKLVHLDIPGTTRRIVIALRGAAVELGEVVLGERIYIGDAQVGATAGRSISGSRYSFNDYGTLTLAKGPTRVEMDYQVVAKTAIWTQTKPLLDRLSGALVASVGALSRPSSVHYGILGPVRWAEDLPDEYEYSFTIMGVS